MSPLPGSIPIHRLVLSKFLLTIIIVIIKPESLTLSLQLSLFPPFILVLDRSTSNSPSLVLFNGANSNPIQSAFPISFTSLLSPSQVVTANAAVGGGAMAVVGANGGVDKMGESDIRAERRSDSLFDASAMVPYCILRIRLYRILLASFYHLNSYHKQKVCRASLGF